MFDYYKMFGYVSNSTLGELFNVLNGIHRPDNLQDIFDFGNLVDGLVTEIDKIDLESNTMTDQNRKVVFDQYKMQQAILMQEAVLADPMFSLLMQDCKMQHVMLRKAHVMYYQGNKFTLPMRCKYDLFRPRDMAIDLKTTACTTYKAFVKSLVHLNYDRQGALYIDLGKVDRILYVGVSKHKNKRTQKHDVFKYMIERDSEMYKTGLQKYSQLGWKYLNYIHHFPAQNIISI